MVRTSAPVLPMITPTCGHRPMEPGLVKVSTHAQLHQPPHCPQPVCARPMAATSLKSAHARPSSAWVHFD